MVETSGQRSTVHAGSSALPRAFAVISLLGAAVVLLGAVPPWLTGRFSGVGYNVGGLFGGPEGLILVGAGLLVACLGIVRCAGAKSAVLPGAQAVVAGTICWVAVADLAAGTYTPGLGLWLSLMGAVVTLAGCWPVLTTLRSRFRQH